MRILFSSNAIWAATGYGVQAKHLFPRFQALGHQMAQFAWYGLAGGLVDAGAFPIYPAGHEQYGNDVAPLHAKHFGADLLITLIDAWVQDPRLGQRTSAACGRWVPWLGWFPVDASPPYPALVQAARGMDYPVQYSQFGLAALTAAGGPACRYVPHGVDPTVFQPGDRAAARAKWAIPPDAYLVAMVAANKGYPARKGWPEQLQAFAQFQAAHPEAWLYLWTNTGDKLGGVNLGAIIDTVGINRARVSLVPQYEQLLGIPDTELATLYQAADVLLGASYSEGFGVPLIEAQACGIPVITTRGTSMTELTRNGVAVPSRQRWWVPMGGWQDTPDVPGIVAALEALYARTATETAAAAAEGRDWVVSRFSWDVCVRDYWAPLLDEIAATIAERRAREALCADATGDPTYLARYEALAARDAALPRGPADAWANAHRVAVALRLLQHGGWACGRLLDLGAAEGALGTALAADGVPADYVPVELVPRRVAAGRAAQPAWPWQEAAAETVGTDGEADTVVALELIEHVPDPAALLRNAARVLRPGGRLLVATPNDPAGQWVDGVEHLRGYDPLSLERLVTDAGFTVLARGSTVPGLYGPGGLLQTPDQLPAYVARAAAADWAYEDGSNLYLLCERPAVPARVEATG